MHMRWSDFLDMWLGFLFRSRNMVRGGSDQILLVCTEIFELVSMLDMRLSCMFRPRIRLGGGRDDIKLCFRHVYELL